MAQQQQIKSEKQKEKLLHQGYLFRFDKIIAAGEQKSWRCEKDGDGCRARIWTDLQNNVLNIPKNADVFHSHDANPANVIKKERVTALKRRAENTMEPPGMIRAVVLENVPSPALYAFPTTNATKKSTGANSRNMTSFNAVPVPNGEDNSGEIGTRPSRLITFETHVSRADRTKTSGIKNGTAEQTNNGESGKCRRITKFARTKSRDKSVQKNGNKENTDSKQIKFERYIPPEKDEVEMFEGRKIEKGDHFDLLQEDDIHILLGENEPKNKKLLREFSEAQFSHNIMMNLELKKHFVPTQIQKAVIPLIQKTRNDFIGLAYTGSGKTAAYMLPIMNELDQVVARRTKVNSESPYMLILAPTKELAEQLYEDARAFATKTNVSVAHSYGHMPIKNSILDKEAGCDIYIATCGRMQHFVEEGYLKLDNLRYLVLDEADKLLKIEKFLNCTKGIKKHPTINPEHRVLMFSATFEEQVLCLAKQFLRTPYYTAQIGALNVPLAITIQEFVEMAKLGKLEKLAEFLIGNKKENMLKTSPSGLDYWEVPKTLVFVEHKRESDRLEVGLRQNNILATSINGDRTLRQRFEAVEDFIAGRTQVLVATDVAARGLNFPGTKCVINYDLPNKGFEERYIHRIGRTGRMGNEGRAVSFFDPNNPHDVKNAKECVRMLEKSKMEVADFLRKIAEEQDMVQVHGIDREKNNDGERKAVFSQPKRLKTNGQVSVPPQQRGAVVEEAWAADSVADSWSQWGKESKKRANGLNVGGQRGKTGTNKRWVTGSNKAPLGEKAKKNEEHVERNGDASHKPQENAEPECEWETESIKW